MLRDVPAELVIRIRAFSRARGLPLPAGAIELIARGLQITEARAKGAEAVNRRATPDERAEASRRAAEARWAKP